MEFEIFTRKPIEVEAFEVTEEFIDNHVGGITAYSGYMIEGVVDDEFKDESNNKYNKKVVVRTPYSVLLGFIGSWIIKDVNDRIFLVNEEEFKEGFTEKEI